MLLLRYIFTVESLPLELGFIRDNRIYCMPGLLDASIIEAARYPPLPRPYDTLPKMRRLHRSPMSEAAIRFHHAPNLLLMPPR